MIKSRNISSFSDKKNQDDYNLINSYLQNGYSFQSVASRPSTVFGENGFNFLSVTNPALTDFEKNLSIFLPYEAINAYYRLKKVFYADFKKILWDSNLGRHEQEILKIKSSMETTKFVENLEKAKQFYASDFPANLELKLALIPIDIGSGSVTSSRGFNLKDAQVVSYIVQLGAVSNLALVFHEFCHSFYGAQSDLKKKEIDDFFLNHMSPHAIFTYRYFNELMATVLGNGWYQEKLNANELSKPWYDVDYINKIAKALLPEVKKYIEQGKSMDQAFLETTIHTAEQLFPNAPFDIGPSMTFIKILSNLSIPVSNIYQLLSNKFNIFFYFMRSPISAMEWDDLNKNHIATPIIITNNKEELDPKIKLLFNANSLGNINLIATIPMKNRFLIWMNLPDVAKLESAIKTLSEKKIFDQKLWLKEL